MTREKRRLQGSFTVEAAYIMALVFLVTAVIIRQAGRLHDETAGAMVLHEGVEKSRHEKQEDPDKIARKGEENMGLLLSFPLYQMSLEKRGRQIRGFGAGGDWGYSIEIEEFRPECFLRKVTLLEDLGERNED